jgi:hypothetical protein
MMVLLCRLLSSGLCWSSDGTTWEWFILVVSKGLDSI